MMKYNQFGHAKEMPPEPPLEEHPFWQKIDDKSKVDTRHATEYRGMIKERKEWQKPKDQSFEEIFNEKRWIRKEMMICDSIRRLKEDSLSIISRGLTTLNRII